MNKKTLSVLSAAMILLSVAGCGNKDVPVPRRTAYPRAVSYDTVYAAVDSLPVVWEANAGTAVNVARKSDGIWWIDISYPGYDATVHCTVTGVSGSDVEEVIDNRTERMHLNLGNASGTISEYTNSAGYYSNLVVAPGVFTTPVQFISVRTDNPRWVVSGAVYFNNAATITSTDSVAPMVETMTRDIRHALTTLSDR